MKVIQIRLQSRQTNIRRVYSTQVERLRETDQLFAISFGILVFTYILSLTKFITMIFVLNFSTSGINSTIIFVVMYFNVVYISLIRKLNISSKKFVMINWQFLIIASFVMIYQNAVLGTLSSAIVLASSSYLLLEYQSLDPQILRKGIIYGIGIIIGQYIIFSGTNFFGTVFGKIIFISILLFSETIIIIYKPTDLPNYNISRSFLIFPILTLFTIFLSSPYLLSSWTFPSIVGVQLFGFNNSLYYLLVSMASISSIWIIWNFYNDLNQIDYSYLIVIILSVLTLIDIIWISLIPVISIFFSILATIYILYSSFNNEPNKIGMSNLFLLQFSLIVLLFLQVSAANWAFMPSVIKGILRGNAGLFLFLFLIVSIFQFLIERRKFNEE